MTDTERTPLHPLEQKVLRSLVDRGWVDFDSIVKATGLLPDQVRRVVSWLTTKKLISSREEISRRLLIHGYPAELLLTQGVRQTGVDIDELRRAFTSNQEFAAGLGNAKTFGLIEVVPRAGKQFVVPKEQTVARYVSLVTSMTEDAKEGGTDEEKIEPPFRVYVEKLVTRNIVKRIEVRSTAFRITKEGGESLKLSSSEDWIERVTPEVVSKIRLTGQSPKLRPIDVTAPASIVFPGRRHPLREFINEVREVYLSMGFTEIVGDSIQSSFWNFDALFTPQDHPARELQDTFYVGGLKDDELRQKGVVANVASAHESGWETGSRGWGYSWDLEEAKRLVLRTHNTALTIRATMDSEDEETRVFSVGKVYRNESIDFKHLAEFHQMEGIVLGEGLNIRDLMGVLKHFYKKLGMGNIKFWPSYFPYTEPSIQVMFYDGKAGKWLEMGGSGIFRPEVALPLGIRKPVLAWGLGLERVLALRLGMSGIREFYASDIDWLRRRREIASTRNIL